MLATVNYGECVRDNDCTYLVREIEDDAAWQDRHKRIISYSLIRYDIPGGPVGRSSIKKLAVEINGALERKWKMDRHLCFLVVMLQCSPEIYGASNVRTRIKQRLKEWTEEKFQTLVSSTELCVESFMSRTRGVTARNEWAKIFSNLFCRGNMHVATSCMCDREKGSVLIPDE